MSSTSCAPGGHSGTEEARSGPDDAYADRVAQCQLGHHAVGLAAAAPPGDGLGLGVAGRGEQGAIPVINGESVKWDTSQA
jgi:hypothetical protein